MKRVLDKIKSKKFRYIGMGDNSRVYEIDGEDLVLKITTDDQELEVADVIQNKYTEYTTFIPVYYAGTIDSVNSKSIIMANASELPANIKNKINDFINQFKTYSYDQGGEVSIFDFLNSDAVFAIDPIVKNFLDALQQDVSKTNIPDLDLDLDFSSDNIMIWNGNLVMVDW
jgi:hypothetical protein